MCAKGDASLFRPTVSVIVPTYNRPLFLCELLECLARQTFRDFETIIVNDAGVSVHFVRDLYPELNIRIIDLETNRKHVHARNAALLQAAGEYIMLCDDDDLLLADHMARMMREIEDVDLVYSDAEIFDYRIEGRARVATRRFLFAYKLDVEAMRKFSTFIPSGTLYRKRIHDAIGLFDPDVYHYWDWDFFLRVAERFRVKRVPVASVLYAFSGIGEHMSADLEQMRPYLNKLSAKHGLGDLPTKNFFLLLQEPDVKSRQAPSQVLWDGRIAPSRWRE